MLVPKVESLATHEERLVGTEESTACMLKKKHLGSLFAQGSHDLRCSLSSEGYAALKFLWLSLTPEPKLGRNRLSQVQNTQITGPKRDNPLLD